MRLPIGLLLTLWFPRQRFVGRKSAFFAVFPTAVSFEALARNFFLTYES